MRRPIESTSYGVMPPSQSSPSSNPALHRTATGLGACLPWHVFLTRGYFLVRRIMSAFSFGGLWIYPSATFSQHDDFMFIDEDRRRIVSFFVMAADQPKRAPMRNW